MDKELLDKLIEIVTNPDNYNNNYKDFEKLLLTLSEDEINYFLVKCHIHLFYSIELSKLLINNIPVLYKKYMLAYTDSILDHYEQEKIKSINLYNNNKLSDDEFKKMISKYKSGTNKILRFRKTYMELINSKIN